MKKFYSVIAAAALGSMISASAFTTLNSFEKKLDGRIRAYDQEKLDLSLEKMKAHSFEGAQSRAGETIDITNFTQCLYYDYFFNWYFDEPGASGSEEAPAFRNLQSSCGVDIVDNNDGTLTIVGLYGVDQFNPTMYITEEGGLEMKAGEVLFENAQYQYVLYTGVVEDGYLTFTDEGMIPMNIYLNGIEPQNPALAVRVMNKANGQAAGYYCILLDPIFLAPNATLSYTYEGQNANGQTVTAEVKNRVYTEFREAVPDADPDSDEAYDRIMISNVNTFNQGVVVNFRLMGDYIVAFESIALESQVDGANKNTGDFYMSSLWTEGGTPTFDTVVFAESPSETEIKWPCYVEGMFPVSSIDSWSVASMIGYTFGERYAATLTFDSEGSEGISDVITDNSANVPAVYYNLQGVQVAAPSAGQVYIVKQGSKVSKQIIK